MNRSMKHSIQRKSRKY